LGFAEATTTAVDRGKAFNVVFLDFAKAFDKVRRLKKMAAHGLTGELRSWVASWQTNRCQRVVLYGKFSTCEDVLLGHWPGDETD
jgi:hypothetical protein